MLSHATFPYRAGPGLPVLRPGDDPHIGRDDVFAGKNSLDRGMVIHAMSVAAVVIGSACPVMRKRHHMRHASGWTARRTSCPPKHLQQRRGQPRRSTPSRPWDSPPGPALSHTSVVAAEDPLRGSSPHRPSTVIGAPSVPRKVARSRPVSGSKAWPTATAASRRDGQGL